MSVLACPYNEWGRCGGAKGRALKYVVLIMDGASGWPLEAFAGRTSLETASLPNLDLLAGQGTLGLAHTVPEGMEPSSAVACMSLLGFDPALYYAGRGPIEAMAMGIELEPGEVAMRCNLVTVADGAMASYSAGNITSQEAAVLVEALQRELGDERLRFPSRRGLSPDPDRQGRRRPPGHQLRRRARHQRPAGRRCASEGTGSGAGSLAHGEVEGDPGRTSRQSRPGRPGASSGDADLALLAGHAPGAHAYLLLALRTFRRADFRGRPAARTRHPDGSGRPRHPGGDRRGRQRLSGPDGRCPRGSG